MHAQKNKKIKNHWRIMFMFSPALVFKSCEQTQMQKNIFMKHFLQQYSSVPLAVPDVHLT